MFLVLDAEARVPEDQPMTLKSHSEARSVTTVKHVGEILLQQV